MSTNQHRQLEPMPGCDGLPIAVGTLVDDKYVIERVIGIGAMGVVVSAIHRDLDTRVALKFLLPAVLAKHPEAIERFAREAQAAARVTCEHVVKVLDVARSPGGVPYIVMEFVEGEDLDTVLMRERQLPPELAVDYIIQASVAIAEAHVAGVIHRDLKPSNLFLAKRSDGTSVIKVLDFGISKLTSRTSLSQPGPSESRMGTPLYMSPEQLTNSETVDQRSDVWALGMVLHEFVTGEPAFLGSDVSEVCAKILSSLVPPRPSSIRPDLPLGLEAIITRALSKDPEKRYANVGELARDLSLFAPASARPNLDRILRIFRTSGTWVPSILPRSADAEIASVAPVARSARRLRSSAKLAVAFLAAVLALGMVGLLRSLTRSNPKVVTLVTVALAAPLTGPIETIEGGTVAPAPETATKTPRMEPAVKPVPAVKVAKPPPRTVHALTATPTPAVAVTDLYGGRK